VLQACYEKGTDLISPTSNEGFGNLEIIQYASGIFIKVLLDAYDTRPTNTTPNALRRATACFHYPLETMLQPEKREKKTKQSQACL
jgi:hypothetical protein